MHICWHNALLTALAGGATAQAMTLWGGSFVLFLPPLPVLMAAAVVGAGLVGLFASGLYGRPGVWGWVCAALSWPVVTALGAGLGSLLLSVAMGGAHSVGYLLEEAAPLGLLAVGDGIATRAQVAGVWVLSGLLVQKAMLVQRALT